MGPTPNRRLLQGALAHRRMALAAALLAVTTLQGMRPADAERPNTQADPLPSWNDGQAKRAIVAFVRSVTIEGNPDFLPPAERVAVFDNDGTLWPEIPVVQGVFLMTRLRAMAAGDPSLRARPGVKAALDGDLAYFERVGEEGVMGLLALTHANLTDDQFTDAVESFFDTASHPTLGVLYTELAYRPMVELLTFLRAQGFRTYICSGGGTDFMRVVSTRMYGIPPEQVMGSRIKKAFVEQYGRTVLWRLPLVEFVNDKDGKPVEIKAHVGQRPSFAAGNVRSGGDIAMLRFTSDRPGRTLQILINHDDPKREFAYQEADGASLRAAQQNGFTVVSMKNDWKAVFGVSGGRAAARR